MVGNEALGLMTTGSWAGILAVLANTCLVQRTVRVAKTFWTAALVRVSVVSGNAITNSYLILGSAPSVGTAW